MCKRILFYSVFLFCFYLCSCGSNESSVIDSHSNTDTPSGSSELRKAENLPRLHNISGTSPELNTNAVALREQARQAEQERAVIFVSVCKRSIVVKEVILDKIKKECSAITEQDLVTIESFDLRNKGIQNLKAGDFSGFSNLVHLFLNSNQLGELPDGIFASLSNLKTLYLNNNQLRMLSVNTFASLSNLTVLNLQDNLLGTNILPIGIFDNFHFLTTLNLKKNQLKTLPVGIFNQLLSNLSSSDRNLSLYLEDNLFDEVEEDRIKEELKDKEGLRRLDLCSFFSC